MDNEAVKKKVFDKRQGLEKAAAYCAYQARSQQEVRQKLYDWGLYANDIEDVISELIQQNFLNEERFAKAYAIGKFRQKNWGRKKIRQGLKLKRVSDVLIKKALSTIDEEDYLTTLKQVLTKKAKLLKEKDPRKKEYKLMSYALGKGFESDLILFVLKNSELS